MDWQTLLGIAGIVLFVILMMRGCGGMMASGCGTGGGCGMGSRRRPDSKGHEGPAPGRPSSGER